VRQVPCPRCGTLTPYGPENPWRPFCSERCKLIDFGDWAAERYRLPLPPDEDAAGPDEPGPEDPEKDED